MAAAHLLGGMGSAKPPQATRPVWPVRTTLLTTKAQHQKCQQSIFKLTPLWWDGLAFCARFVVELPAICLGTGAMIREKVVRAATS